MVISAYGRFGIVYPKPGVFSRQNEHQNIHSFLR